jgi:hypothetical protein
VSAAARLHLQTILDSAFNDGGDLVGIFGICYRSRSHRNPEIVRLDVRYLEERRVLECYQIFVASYSALEALLHGGTGTVAHALENRWLQEKESELKREAAVAS